MRIEERKPWTRQLICGTFIPEQPPVEQLGDGKDWKLWKSTGEQLIRITHLPVGETIKTDAVRTFQPPRPTITQGPIRVTRSSF